MDRSAFMSVDGDGVAGADDVDLFERVELGDNVVERESGVQQIVQAQGGCGFASEDYPHFIRSFY